MKATSQLTRLFLAVLVSALFATQAFAAASSKDKSFVDKAAKGSLAEIELGELASQQASDPQVKEFAQTLVDEHQNATQELKQLAQDKGIKLPSEPAREHQKTADRLKKMSGAQFDKAYIDAIVKEHKKDISAFEQAAKTSQDEEIRAWASKMVPAMKEHLETAQSMQRQVSGKAAGGAAGGAAGSSQ